MNEWITNNYKELFTICKKVSKEADCYDLLQVCVEQFIKNKKTNDIPDKEKFYFFATIVRNNWYNVSAPYGQIYRKYKFVETNNLEITDEPYQEPLGISWVENEIKKIKEEEWYYGRLFELYIEEGCSIKNLSLRTTIPMANVSRDIKRVRNKLNEIRKKYYDGL